MSKIRKKIKPASSVFHEKVKGMNKKVISCPITSSITACLGSLSLKILTQTPAAHIPNSEKHKKMSKFTACSHADISSSLKPRCIKSTVKFVSIKATSRYIPTAKAEPNEPGINGAYPTPQVQMAKAI